jgi:hypothetical protein
VIHQQSRADRNILVSEMLDGLRQAVLVHPTIPGAQVGNMAHHVTVEGAKRRLMLASLRYLDTFVKMDGACLFAERRLYVDWLEERGLS